MPGLDTNLHLDMYREYREKNSLFRRLRRAAREITSPPKLYGMEWGDPETIRPLGFIRDRYLMPYVNPMHTAAEIGPGGGRWTQYLIPFRQLYLIDYHRELLQEARRRFSRPNIRFIKNSGCDFPGIEDSALDFVFSFGCFVHLDLDLITRYLSEMRRVLKRGGNAVIHYSDQNKIMAQVNLSFSKNTPEQMRAMVRAAGFVILEEDLTTMWHSSIVRFTH